MPLGPLDVDAGYLLYQTAGEGTSLDILGLPLCEVNHFSFVTEVTASVQKMCYALG
jgi:hypothetical protein